MECIEQPVLQRTSPSHAVLRLLYEPSAAFADLAARRATWVPVLAVLGVNAGLLLWYFFQFVDYAWFQEQLLSGVSDPAAREQQQSMAIGRQAMGGMAAAGAAVAILGTYVLSSLYFVVVARLRNQACGFGKAFSLSAWASIPTLLLLPLGTLQMLLASHRQVPLEALNPATLNQLLFRLEASHPFAGLLESLSIPLAWNLVLLVIGYQAWTGTPRGAAVRIVLFPYAVVYGIWLAYALSVAT